MRRLLAFHLMLTKKRGLPKSRLLTLKEADARQSEREESLWMQEESASPLLRRRQVSKVKADKEEVSADSLDLEKEEEGNISVGTSTGAIYLFSRQGALKLITPLQLLSCRCKRKCPSSLLLRNPLCGSPAHQ